MSSTQKAAAYSRALGLAAAVIVCVCLMAMGITQDVPRGSLTGRLTMSENGKPLARARFTLTSTTLDPHNEATQFYTARTNSDGEFNFRHIQAGQYELELSARHHEANKSIITITEGKTDTLNIAATPSSPDIKLYASQHVFLPNEQIKLEAHGFAFEDRIKINIYKIDGENIAKHLGIQNALQPLRDAADKGQAYPGSKLVRTDDLKIQNRDAEGAFVEMLKLDHLPDGFYYADCSAGSVHDLAFLNVSEIAMVTKSSTSKTICYVTGLKDGKPVPNAEIFVATRNSLISAGKTDSNGLAVITQKPRKAKTADDEEGDSEEGQDSAETTLLAKSGPSAAVCNFYAYGGRPDGKLFLYTERPIYRPGDLVQFKGVVRRLDGDNFVLPGKGTAKVTIKDPDQNIVTELNVPVNEHGSFSGSFTTSSEAKPGGYEIHSSAFGFVDNTYVSLAAYRKPQVKIDIKPEHPFYALGDTMKVGVNCTYYYGAPAVGAKVKVTAYRQVHWNYGDDEEDDSDYGGYGGSGGEYSFDADAVTDENGKTTIEIPTEATKSTDQDTYYSYDFDYNLSVTVADESGQSFDQQATVPVYQGNYDLRLNSDTYIVQKGHSFALNVAVADRDKNPVANQSVDLAVQRSYYKKKNQFDYEEVREDLTSLKVTTDAQGLATATIPVTESGSIQITGTITDNAGHKVKANWSIYCEGDGGIADVRPQSKFRMTLDKKAYKIGDQAHLIIESDSPGGTALLCVQSEDVIVTKTIQLSEKTTDVDLPVTKAFAPNAYVSLAYVHEKRFMQSTKSIKVDSSDKALTVSVQPGAPKYLPGETASIKVRTTDDHGKPVPAEVSMAVVDESIYALEKDNTDIKRAFYPRRSNSVTTSFSFPEIYLDGGDKGGANIPVRSKFKDTALWRPAVETDKDGKATISFKLPDNTTEWRATVIGASDDTRVGMKTATFQARKPLMARIDGPTFMVQGDTQRIVVAVTNDTEKDADVHVRLKMEGTTAEGQELQRKVSIPAGKAENLEWTVTAGSAGTAGLTASAWIDHGATDAVLKSFPIKPRGRMMVDTSSGPIEGSHKLEFTVDDNADTHSGRLAITVSPSLATVMSQSLDGLIAYPYGCVEQTMDRFMPAVRVEGLVKDMHLPSPKNLTKIPEIARDSLARIATMQHADGGWGWWVYDKSDPFMTAFVLDGLKTAEARGYKSNSIRTEKAVEWAVKYFEKPQVEAPKADEWIRPERLEDRLYLLDALVKYDKRDLVLKVLPTLDWRGASPSDLSYGVWLYHDLGNEYDAKAKELISTMKGYATQDSRAIHWEAQGWKGAEENTAMAFTAFMIAAPEDPWIEKIMRYLMQQRRDNMWSSTYATGTTVRAMDLYLRRAKPLTGESKLEVAVNGKPVKTYSISPSTLFDASYTLRIPMDQLQKGKNTVEFTQTGGGSSYYFADLKQYSTKPQTEAYSPLKGLTVAKSFRVLTATRMEDGTLKLMPSSKPVESASSGDIIECTLLINSKDPREFLMIEDPIPSNCRVTSRDSVDDPAEWSDWWCSLVQLDDRVALFVKSMPAGERKVVYTLRAEGSGQSYALPSTVINMYDPIQQAASAEAPLEVRK